MATRTVGRPPNEALTPIQAEVYRYLFEQTMNNGYQPSYRDVCDHFGWSALNAVVNHVNALVRHGWLAKGVIGVSRSHRFLRLPDGGEFCGFVPRRAVDP